MTAPANTTDKNAGNKGNAAKATTAKATEVKVAVPSETETTETERIPSFLLDNSILADFCRRYLSVFDKITGYNKVVLAEKDSEWNAGKVLAKAREFASPEKGEPNVNVKKAMDDYERLVTETAKARKAVLDVTSKALGITLSAVADRDPAAEAPLKEERKQAIEIGTQLSMIAKMTNDENAASAVEKFLEANPLPAIGRDQTRTFTNDGGSTPKYRVTVTVSKDGNTLLEESGFTKSALELTKPVFGYERGKAPKSDTLRAAWEKAGNSADKTVQNPVEFDDNGLHFVIAKK